jgi:hypothetical protein
MDSRLKGTGSYCPSSPGITGPTIASLSPSSVAAGSAAFALTVNGSNFASGAVVQWNGSNLTTNFSNSTQLTATVSASLIASAGTASITVASGGQTSAATSFAIIASSGGSNPTVGVELTSNTNGAANGTCATPPSVTTFTTSSAQVWLYAYVSNAKAGDSATIDFLRPDGAIYQSDTGQVGAAAGCIADVMNISGAAAASYPGLWTVQVFWNQSTTPLFSLNFTLMSATTTSNTNTYYFPHLAFGGGFQTTLTFVNYSPEAVSCQTTFYSDSGGALQVPFAGGSVSARTDSLGAGADIHVQTTASASGATSEGWAQLQCSGPVKASLLYRLYNGSVAQGEAGVNATTTPATEFVTFAQTQTGIAYANPSIVPATVTITALDSTGAGLGQTSLTLQPNAHGSANIGPLIGLSSFTGSVQITSTAPIVSLSLNAEAFPVFSSLPPGDLPAGTPLANGTAGGAPANGTDIYYFPHLAFGGGFQSTLTLVNYSPEAVSCQTTFFADSGGALQVPFTGGSVSARTDSLGAGADIHVQTTAGANGATSEGWAQSQCTGPVKASLLYRLYNGSVAQGEAGVNATTTPATEFVTFAQTQTGIAYANPSAVPATVTITALDSTGAGLGQTSLTLQPNAHGSANIGPQLGLSSFTGSVQITSTAPIVSLSLNAEVFPVFSSLPPGDLPAGTPLAPVSITSPVASDHVAVVSGNSQTASAGQAFSAPLVVQVTDSQGNPLSGVPVTWTVSQGTIALANSSTVTDAGGQSSTTATAESSAGTVVIKASAGSGSAQFTLTVTAGSATSLTLYSSGQNVTNGRDNSYQILRDTTGQIVAPAPAFLVSLPGWGASVPGAAWIAPSADQGSDRLGCCTNTADTYQTTFTVSGDPSAAMLYVTMAADDYVDVYLNGFITFAHPSTVMWNAPVSFSISSGFNSGTNTLDFAVTNSGGPTGLLVAITSPTTGLTQVTPGQTLTISGSFNTAANVETTVTFSDNAGYQLSVLPLSVTTSTVSVLVPPYVNSGQGTLTSGSVWAIVVQQPAGGLTTTTQPPAVQIGALPPTGFPAGTITLAVLSQLAQLATNTNNAWQGIAQTTSGQLNVSRLNLPALQAGVAAFQTQIQSLASGSASQVQLGQVGGQTVYLDAGSLSLIDQLFYGYYLGLASLSNQSSATFQSWFTGLIGATAPTAITSNTHQLRGIASVLIALAEFMATFSHSIPANTVGACSWIATVSNSASILNALNGAATEIDQQPPDTQDFQTTMDTISDSTYQSQTGGLATTTSDSPELDSTATTDTDIESAVDPTQPNSVTNQTIDFSNLFNAGSTGVDMSGTWTGSYQTPVTGECSNLVHSGQLTFTITGNSVAGFSGSASIMGIKYFDPSTCDSIASVSSTSGTVSGTLGQNGSGTASFTLDTSSVPDPASDSFSFNFTATLSGNTMTGTMTNRTGSFTVTR